MRDLLRDRLANGSYVLLESEHDRRRDHVTVVGRDAADTLAWHADVARFAADYDQHVVAMQRALVGNDHVECGKLVTHASDELRPLRVAALPAGQLRALAQQARHAARRVIRAGR